MFGELLTFLCPVEPHTEIQWRRKEVERLAALDVIQNDPNCNNMRTVPQRQTPHKKKKNEPNHCWNPQILRNFGWETSTQAVFSFWGKKKSCYWNEQKGQNLRSWIWTCVPSKIVSKRTWNADLSQNTTYIQSNFGTFWHWTFHACHTKCTAIETAKLKNVQNVRTENGLRGCLCCHQ